MQHLKAEFKAGRVKAANGKIVGDALETVRFGADGAADLGSVSPFVRDMAEAVAALHDREDSKQQFTLAQIQDTYFDFLGLHFGEVHEMMLARKLTPHDVAAGDSAAPEAVESFIKFIPEFLQALGEFWSRMGAGAIAQAEKMSILGNNSKTPVLPDIFLRSMTSLTQGPDDKRVYALALRAMETLQSRGDKPNLVVLPAPTDLSP